jgi:beta-galactosidase
LLDLLVERIAGEAGIELTPLPEGLRMRRTASHTFAFNYSNSPIDTAPHGLGSPLLGKPMLDPAEVAVWVRT